MTRNTVVAGQSKLQKACQQLEVLVRQREAGARLPKVTQLTQELGVGMSTLNEALGELERHGLIERRHGVGIFASPRAGHTIALICDPTILQLAGHSPFWQMLLKQVQERAQLEHETLELHFTRFGKSEAPFNQSLTREFREHRIDGVIGIGLHGGVAHWIEGFQRAFVTYAGPGVYTVSVDLEREFDLGVAALFERGCRDIGFWLPVTPNRAYDSPQHIIDYFVAALEKRGLKFQNELFWHPRPPLPDDDKPCAESYQEQGYRAAMDVFAASSRRRRPDGLLITDDMMTHGALVAMERLDPKLRASLAIATHANRGSQVLLGRADLILMETDPNALVNRMFETLERLIRGETVASPLPPIAPTLRYQ